MSFNELSWKRKSVRNFKPDEISFDKINALIDAARSAPSAGNCQPWHFYVVCDPAVKQKIFEASGSGQSFIPAAPVNIVVCADIARTIDRYGDRGRNLYCLQDTAAAIQNLLLCAVDLGLAACWCGAFNEKAVAEALGLGEDMRPIALIPVGYAANDPEKRSRRPIEEIATFIGFKN